MKLRDWRYHRKLSFDAAAKAVGASNGSLFRKWERGLQIPRPEQMVNIYLATHGAVTPNDFYDLPSLPDSPEAAHG